MRVLWFLEEMVREGSGLVVVEDEMLSIAYALLSSQINKMRAIAHIKCNYG